MCVVRYSSLRDLGPAPRIPLGAGQPSHGEGGRVEPYGVHRPPPRGEGNLCIIYLLTFTLIN